MYYTFYGNYLTEIQFCYYLKCILTTNDTR